MPATPNERQQALQTLSGELARLAATQAGDGEVLQAILQRLMAATDALGGVFWLVSRRSGTDLSLRIGAAKELEAGAGEADSAQRQQVQRAASECILSNQPLVLMPAPEGQEPVTPGVLVNYGPHAIAGSPLRSGDDQLGALQLWFPASSEPRQLADIALMLQVLLNELGPRLRSRQLRDLGAQSARQQKLLQFSSDLTGVLEAENGARLAAAHARELLGINRVSVVLKKGDRWQVLAVSGLEHVDARSRAIQDMRAFVAREAKETTWVVVLPAKAETGDAENLMRSAALLPLRENADTSLLGCLLCESTDEATFGPPGKPGDPLPPAIVLGQWLAAQTSKALKSALVHQSIPFSKWLLGVGRWRQQAGATRARRTWTRTLVIGSLLVVAGLWPIRVRIEGDCTLLPVKRALITAEAPGRVEQVAVREGDAVKTGQLLGKLDTKRLETELEAAIQARLRLEAEAARQRGLGKEALARIASLEAQAETEKENQLKLEISLAELKSPMDGLVMTKDVHLKLGTFLQAGEPLAEVANVATWDLRIDAPEADMSLVLDSLKEQAPLAVQYLLYTQSGHELHTQVKSAEQISPALHGKASGTVFSITLPQVEIPEKLRPLMRPGLTGRAKIDLDRRPAAAVLFRNFTRWLRMRWWL